MGRTLRVVACDPTVRKCQRALLNAHLASVGAEKLQIRGHRHAIQPHTGNRQF